MGVDFVCMEKFMMSIQDGIDIWDILCYWYEGEIYVKVMFFNWGCLDIVVMLFDFFVDLCDYMW